MKYGSNFTVDDNFRVETHRRLSLNYLQLNSSGGKSYEVEGPRRRNSRRRDSHVSPLSDKDINNIRRSQVWDSTC